MRPDQRRALLELVRRRAEQVWGCKLEIAAFEADGQAVVVIDGRRTLIVSCDGDVGALALIRKSVAFLLLRPDGTGGTLVTLEDLQVRVCGGVCVGVGSSSSSSSSSSSGGNNGSSSSTSRYPLR